ncbi:MAG: DNA recombination protein RmuC [Flavobacteriales bacterium]|nr:DNA recombination protein RmuC [Flavobacteriales bacterium]
MDILTATIGLLCLAAGFIAGYFIALRKTDRTHEADVARSEAETLLSELASERSRTEMHLETISDLKAETESLRQKLSDESVRAARLETAKTSVESQIEAQRQDIGKMQESFRKDFELLANKIFNEKTEKFTVQSRASIDQVLEPLKLRLKDFQEKVESSHKESLMQATSLREELKHMRETGQRMSKETENLTRALKNDSKIQGNWGEMILESILEASGLIKERQYFMQQSFTSDEGRRLQPDVMIKLPEEKWVIVDSKVSLTAYERFAASEDEDERKTELKAHITSLRTHIKGLSGKKYQEVADGQNLDFILLFVPIEPAYLTALNADPSIFNEAYDKGIIMVCPSTLIASLKIIASTWKHEYQNKNALEIAKRGKLLLEKFINFVDDMKSIGTQLEKTDKVYQSAMHKLRDRPGNLINQAKQLEDLGIKTSKQLEK